MVGVLKPHRRICVFCGSRTGAGDQYRSAAQALAVALVQRDLGLVYGGGNIGLMGIIADSMLQAGGEVVGVIPKQLVARELAHSQLSELRIVDTMHQRKAVMSELADAFIALPGGFGTLDEFFEILTWSQLGIHDKPSGLLNVDGYFDSLLSMLDHAVAEQFLHARHRALVHADIHPGSLVDRLLHELVNQADSQPASTGNFS